MRLHYSLASLLLRNWFLPSWNKPTLIQNPSANSSTFLFWLLARNKWHHFVSIGNLLQRRGRSWRSRKVHFKISRQTPKLKRVGFGSDLFLVSGKIFDWTHGVFLVEPFLEGLPDYGFDFIGFRLFDWFSGFVVFQELVVDDLRHLNFIINLEKLMSLITISKSRMLVKFSTYWLV
jgi:hypothetical protein